MSEADSQPACPVCGGRSNRNYAPASAKGGRPEQVSDALGVHPSQVPDILKRFPHHRFNRRGQMLFSSNSELQRVLKDIGYVDRNKH